MNSLSNIQLKDDFDYKCTRCAENNINLKCGNITSILIPNRTVVGTSYIVSSINVKSTNSTILKFTSNITNTNFIGSISFQVLKLCDNSFTLIPIGPPWIFSRSAANTGSESFSFFVCDHNICLNKCCTYTIKATIVDSLIRTLSITDIGNGGAVTLVGPAAFIVNCTDTIVLWVGNIQFSNVSGDINIIGSFGTVSQSGSTITINDIEPGSFIFTDIPNFNTVFISSGTLTITVTPVNGDVIERRFTSGTSIITNATLVALSL